LEKNDMVGVKVEVSDDVGLGSSYQMQVVGLKRWHLLYDWCNS
jgi:hypothetical protein